MTSSITIINDTGCGWCYGASPVFDALVASGAKVEVLHKHLFAGHNAPRLAVGKGTMIAKADAQIAALTGQVLSEAYTTNILRSTSEVLAADHTAFYGRPEQISATLF